MLRWLLPLLLIALFIYCSSATVVAQSDKPIIIEPFAVATNDSQAAAEMRFETFALLFGLFNIIVLSPLGAILMSNKGRSSLAGYLLCLLLNVIGLLIILLLSPYLSGHVFAKAVEPHVPLSTKVDTLASLTELKQILDLGLISQAEYDTKKSEILARM